jgi:chemotaxis protein CheD
MTTLEASNTARETLVGMGQIAAGRAPARMKAVVGSCIALALYHPRLKTGVMAHIVLPDSAGRAGTPGKFADTALPEMLRLLKAAGTPTHGLTASFAGGANMFGSSGPLQIGDANVKAVVEELKGAGLRVVGQDVGGTKGRRVVFDCGSGDMTVERAGQPARTL